MRLLRPVFFVLALTSALPVIGQTQSTCSPTPITSPQTIQSDKQGVLNVHLTETASPNGVTLTTCGGNGQATTTTLAGYLYDDGSGPNLIPRVWRVNRGDTIKVTVTNNLPPASPSGPQPSNLHFHGFNVSPGPTPPVTQPYQDNVFVTINSGTDSGADDSASYAVHIPANHPDGMHWFHPHPHGFTERQVIAGLSGAAIVGDLMNDYYPAFMKKNGGNVMEQYWLLKDIDTNQVFKTQTVAAGRLHGLASPLTKTINGVPPSGAIAATQNQVLLWDFGNTGTNAFFDLEIFELNSNKSIPFHIVAIDGNPTPVVLVRNHLFLPPGGRMQALIAFPDAGVGQYQLYSANVGTGPWGDPNPMVQLAQIDVTAAPNSTAVALPAAPDANPFPRLSLRTLVQRAKGHTRSIDFEEDGPSMKQSYFYICGKMFNPAAPPPTQIVSPAAQPTVEEWTVTNSTQEAHVFHIHQTDFVVEAINGAAPPETSRGLAVYQDTVNVPPATPEGKPGSVTLLIPFEIQGTFVYHCHLLGHEDDGMMASICVKESAEEQCVAPMPNMTMSMPMQTYSGPQVTCNPPFAVLK